mgnify:CR=1 FL=1
MSKEEIKETKMKLNKILKVNKTEYKRNKKKNGTKIKEINQKKNNLPNRRCPKQVRIQSLIHPL